MTNVKKADRPSGTAIAICEVTYKEVATRVSRVTSNSRLGAPELYLLTDFSEYRSSYRCRCFLFRPLGKTVVTAVSCFSVYANITSARSVIAEC